ncbi:LysR family transcriptional regulator [Pseudochelatococcus sp. B33]
MSRLPSLRALATLEAVVRTGNIVAAANELCVTPGAVSKQLAQLQEGVSAPLFEKGHRLRPTPLAVELAQAVGAGLQQIQAGWEAVSRESEQRVITLAANATLAFHWIIPRLMAAEEAAGGRPVRVTALHTTDDWQHAQFDIGIMRTPWHPEGWQRRALGVEQLTLLAPPERVAALQRSGPAGIAAETVFVADTRPGELEAWLEAAGIGRPVNTRRTPHFYIAAQAAAAGHGCIVGPPLVLSDLIDAGRLTAPFPAIVADGARLTAAFDPDRCDPSLVDALLQAVFDEFRAWNP